MAEISGPLNLAVFSLIEISGSLKLAVLDSLSANFSGINLREKNLAANYLFEKLAVRYASWEKISGPLTLAVLKFEKLAVR